MGSMKNVIIALVVLVLLGGGAYLLTSGDGGDEMASGGDSSELSTISNLLARGTDIQCNYDTTDDAGNHNEGTVYFSDGSFRGMFTLTEDGGDPMMSNVINDGMTQYIWEEGSDEGFKSSVSVDTSGVEESGSDERNQSPVDDDDEFEFNCSDWDRDGSFFTPPADVAFTDLSAQIDELNEALQEANEDLAGVCAGIEDADARAACEAQLQ